MNKIFNIFKKKEAANPNKTTYKEVFNYHQKDLLNPFMSSDKPYLSLSTKGQSNPHNNSSHNHY